MPYSLGVFSLTYDWVTEQASPPIEISKLKTQETDIATGLSNCILRDGTGVPTASTPWNSQKITGLGNATLTGDATNAGQIQSGSLTTLGSVSGGDTITGNLTPAIAAYTANMVVRFTPASANTTAATLNINSVGAKSIKKGNGTALVANDLLTTVPAFCVYDGTNFVLLNPQAALPALNGAALTSLSAANLTGSLPAISGASLTSLTAANLSGQVPVANGGTAAATAANARTNLGVTATGADTTYCFRSNNLSDVTASTARSNLGLAAIAASGSASDLGSGTVANARLPNIGSMPGITIASDPGGTPSGAVGAMFFYY